MRCKDIGFGTGQCAYEIFLPWKTEFNGDSKCVSIDKCLLPEVIKLWELGIKTTGCCCGHGNSKLAFIGVRFEDITNMKNMGYKILHNPCRPNDEDSFIPKTELIYDENKDSVEISCKTCKHENYCDFDTQCFGTNKENWEPK